MVAPNFINKECEALRDTLAVVAKESKARIARGDIKRIAWCDYECEMVAQKTNKVCIHGYGE